MATRKIIKPAIPDPPAGDYYPFAMAIKEHLEIASARRPGIAPVGLVSTAEITDTEATIAEIISKLNELILAVQGQQVG